MCFLLEPALLPANIAQEEEAFGLSGKAGQQRSLLGFQGNSGWKDTWGLSLTSLCWNLPQMLTVLTATLLRFPMQLSHAHTTISLMLFLQNSHDQLSHWIIIVWGFFLSINHLHLCLHSQATSAVLDPGSGSSRGLSLRRHGCTIVPLLKWVWKWAQK